MERSKLKKKVTFHAESFPSWENEDGLATVMSLQVAAVTDDFARRIWHPITGRVSFGFLYQFAVIYLILTYPSKHIFNGIIPYTAWCISSRYEDRRSSEKMESEYCNKSLEMVAKAGFDLGRGIEVLDRVPDYTDRIPFLGVCLSCYGICCLIKCADILRC